MTRQWYRSYLLALTRNCTIQNIYVTIYAECLLRHMLHNPINCSDKSCTSMSRHHGCQIKAPIEIPRTSRQYGIERFKGASATCLQPRSVFSVWSLSLFNKSFNFYQILVKSSRKILVHWYEPICCLIFQTKFFFVVTSQLAV